jgi:hypothetical protein
MNFLDTLDPIYTISSKEYFNVTKEQLEQSKKEAARKARMEILSQMDEESRERLRKKELQVYARQKNVPKPLLVILYFPGQDLLYHQMITFLLNQHCLEMMK